MNCPHCHTEDITRCCVIYAQGTFSGSSHGTAFGYYLPGLGLGQATVYGSTASSSALANVVAPPERPVWRGNGCLIIFLMVVLSIPTHFFIRWIEELFGLSEGPWEVLTVLPGLLMASLIVVMHIAQRVNYRREIEQPSHTILAARIAPLLSIS